MFAHQSEDSSPHGVPSAPPPYPFPPTNPQYAPTHQNIGPTQPNYSLSPAPAMKQPECESPLTRRPANRHCPVCNQQVMIITAVAGIKESN